MELEKLTYVLTNTVNLNQLFVHLVLVSPRFSSSYKHAFSERAGCI